MFRESGARMPFLGGGGELLVGEKHQQGRK